MATDRDESNEVLCTAERKGERERETVETRRRDMRLLDSRRNDNYVEIEKEKRNGEHEAKINEQTVTNTAESKLIG